MHRYIRCNHPPPPPLLLPVLPLRRSLEKREGEREEERKSPPLFRLTAISREDANSRCPRPRGEGGRKAEGNLLNSTRYASLVAAVCSAAATI